AHHADSLQNLNLQLDVYYDLGDFYRLQQNFEKAAEYLKKSLNFDPNQYPAINYCMRVHTLASIYKQFKSKVEQRKGIVLYEEMLADNCNGRLNKFQRAKALNNLGSAYVEIGDFVNGELRLKAALEMKRAINKPNSLAYTLNELATFHFRQKQYKEAFQYAKEALTNITTDVYLTTDVLDNLSLSCANLGKYEEAFEYSNQLYNLKDSLFHDQKQTLLAEMATKYNLAKKEKDLATKDLEIAQQKNQFNQIVMIALGCILIIGLLYYWARQQWQKQRMEAQKLQELDQIKSTFFTNISHEFRTPLTLISSIFEEKHPIGNQEQVQITNKEADIVRRSSQRLLQLIDQLLDLAKLDAGKMKLQVSKGNVHQFLSQLVRSFEPLAQQHQLRLQFVSRQNNFTFWYDADKLEKIIINLLSNAIKFTPPGGEINLFLESVEHYAQIVVQDNGIGIDQEHITHIFDRFHQIDNSSTRAYEGSGIGLALVQQMVLAHRGKIQVSSQKGNGTTFIIQLPLEDTTYERSEKRDDLQPVTPIQILPIQSIAEADPREKSPEKTSQGPLLLLIEDNADLRFVLRQQLQSQYQIIESPNGKTGIEMAIKAIPDLIVCDVMMPGLDGYQVCEQLKRDERTSHIPIILLTAKATQEEKIEGLTTGADDYLIKPFDRHELAIRIRNLIQQRNELQRRYAGEVVYRTKDEKVISKEDAFIQNLLKIIDREMSNENFGVEELSQAVHMSRSQLYRKLKALTGKTPNAFLRSIRLERAHQLLSQHAGNVGEIALMAGFSNANYFSKCFKEAYGKSPGAVLKSSPVE
ncbi:MAG: ATP-binding protein, partial [Bacteroidota bacterium]